MIPINFTSNENEKLNFVSPILVERYNYILDKSEMFDFFFLFKEDNLRIIFNDQKEVNLQLPMNIKSLTNVFDDFNNLISYDIIDLEFFPFRSLISKGNKKMSLTEIHNKILSNLLLYKEGLEKNNLYKIIWPKDKDFNENKLDTHLTNFKNFIFDNFDTKANITTIKRRIFIDL